MGKADWYKPGDYNQIDDRTGFKVKASWTRKEWTGSITRTKSWEERHPQDLIRSVLDRQDIDDPNPEQPRVFLTGRDFRVIAAEGVFIFRVDSSGNLRTTSNLGSTITKAGDL